MPTAEEYHEIEEERKSEYGEGIMAARVNHALMLPSQNRWKANGADHARNNQELLALMLSQASNSFDSGMIAEQRRNMPSSSVGPINNMNLSG